jgi:hypothetical protein
MWLTTFGGMEKDFLKSFKMEKLLVLVHPSPQGPCFLSVQQQPLGLCFVFVSLCFSGGACFLVLSRFLQPACLFYITLPQAGLRPRAPGTCTYYIGFGFLVMEMAFGFLLLFSVSVLCCVL